MKLILTILFIILAALGGVNRIAEINSYTKKAQQAMAARQYQVAIKHYEHLIYELQVDDDKARLNLAHAYYQNNQPDKAYNVYSQLLKKEDKGLQSVSALQLGILAAGFKDYEPALQFYKRALVIDPANEQARYNYELLKKYLQENPQDEQDQIPPPNPEKQDQQQEQEKEKHNNQPQKKPDNQGSEQDETDSEEDDQQNPDRQPEQNKAGQNQNGGSRPQQPGSGRQQEQKQGQQPGDEQGLSEGDENQSETEQPNQGGRRYSEGNQNAQTRYQRLKQMNISPEKANTILDAMRKSELQYIQQIPRKGTGKKDNSRPDW